MCNLLDWRWCQGVCFLLVVGHDGLVCCRLSGYQTAQAAPLNSKAMQLSRRCLAWPVANDSAELLKMAATQCLLRAEPATAALAQGELQCSCAVLAASDARFRACCCSDAGGGLRCTRSCVRVQAIGHRYVHALYHNDTCVATQHALKTLDALR